ncbi:ADAMTS10 [Symbiodinium natans]|uniref:ADAMTS10 protein n=1 Tax=Symbiodinium natans TaxID=878477 RepID=A0A812L842_9DINO|nr:ADAMTS10 [Symbiodinium natans]
MARGLRRALSRSSSRSTSCSPPRSKSSRQSPPSTTMPSTGAALGDSPELLQPVSAAFENIRQAMFKELARDPAPDVTAEQLKATTSWLKSIVNAMVEHNESFSRLGLTTLSDNELHRNQEIAREASRQLTVLLAESTKQFDRNHLQLVKVGPEGLCQEFRANLATFSNFLSQFWDTKWLGGLVPPEFAQQKDLAVKLMSDLQKQRNRCRFCHLDYVGNLCMKCDRCSCGYMRNQAQARRCGHFSGTPNARCNFCGEYTAQAGTFCTSCGTCPHGQQIGKKRRGVHQCGCQEFATNATAQTLKTTLVSDAIKLDQEAPSCKQLNDLATMADALARLCRTDAKAMQAAEKKFKQKMELLKEFAEAINEVPKVLRRFLLFRCGSIKEDPASLKEWLSKAEVEDVHRQLEEFRDEASEEKIARRFGKSRTVSEGSWSMATSPQAVRG